MNVKMRNHVAVNSVVDLHGSEQLRKRPCRRHRLGPEGRGFVRAQFKGLDDMSLANNTCVARELGGMTSSQPGHPKLRDHVERPVNTDRASASIAEPRPALGVEPRRRHSAIMSSLYAASRAARAPAEGVLVLSPLVCYRAVRADPTRRLLPNRFAQPLNLMKSG